MNKQIDEIAKLIYKRNNHDAAPWDYLVKHNPAETESYRAQARTIIAMMPFDEIRALCEGDDLHHKMTPQARRKILSLLPTPPDEPKRYEGLFKLEIPEGMTKDEYMQGVKERLDANLKPIFDAIEKAQESDDNDPH